MRKLVTGIIFAFLVMSCTVAFANLQDNRASIASQYGEYRFVVDTDKQLWPKADWESKGQKVAEPSTYIYYFTRQGNQVQLAVTYDKNKPDSVVRTQRYTLTYPIQIKEFKTYFPEVYPLLKAEKAVSFGTFKMITRNFQEPESPVTLGVLVRELINDSYYTLLAFNIKDQGRWIKQLEAIDENTYIQEFTIERAYRSTVHDKLDASSPEWKAVKNFF